MTHSIASSSIDGLPIDQQVSLVTTIIRSWRELYNRIIIIIIISILGPSSSAEAKERDIKIPL